jgi:microcin C transport system permease protein
MKNSIIEQIKQDYVRSALARGVTRQKAILKHALRNALLPLVTGFGAILTLAFSGSILIERIFNLDGVGRLSLEASLQRDYPILMAAITIGSVLGLLGQLLSDILLRVVDPRIDFSKKD